MTLEEYETLVEAQRLEVIRLNGLAVELQEKLDQEIGANALMQDQCNQYAGENAILHDTLKIYRNRLSDAGLPTD